MPYRGEELVCPGCHVPLVAVAAVGQPAHRCDRCRGIWMAERALLRLIAESPDAQPIDELMEHNDGSPRRSCAQCGATMNLAWIDFLQLDRCEAEHGVWLDDGELARVLTSRLEALSSSQQQELMRDKTKPPPSSD
jgi:Zn-finger nucleic acid-binding protein